jgi:glycosyltransferase involved in cell wall biosynthesis
MRYAWDLTFDYLQSSVGRGIQGVALRGLFHYLRQWDVNTANRVDYFIANSHHTARRVWRCYRRPAAVIYPPVAIDRFTPQADKEDFYLTVSRLVPYKKIPLIVQAFNQLQRPLVVIGDGPELSVIQHLANPHIQILGAQPNGVVESYLQRAKAFVYAACEDFGITLIEAQASGTPVIAYGGGGALETVREIRHFPETGTGLLFPTQSIEDLVAAVEDFETIQAHVQVEVLRSHAEAFSPQVFAQRYLSYIERCQSAFQSSHTPKLALEPGDHIQF